MTVNSGERADQQSGERTQWTGLSTDDKPKTVNGASWTSLDTGERWYFYEGMWVIDASGPLLIQKDTFFR